MSLQDKLKAAVSGEKPSLDVEEPAKLDDADTAAEGAWQEGTIQEAILKTAFAEASSYEAPVGAYRNVRLHQVVLPSGEVVKPNKYGYYENLAGEAQGLLDFYATKGLVEKVVEKA
jgi:hypothetical protein